MKEWRWFSFFGVVVIGCALLAQGPVVQPPGPITVTIDGSVVSGIEQLNITSGNGILWSCIPGPCSGTNGALNISAAVNTTSVVNKTILQSGSCTYLNSTNGTTAYTYSLGPTCQALTVYRKGMRFWLTTDAKCATSCSLNIDTLGVRNIKRSDGTTDPGGLFDFTQGVAIWFDGTVFRLE